MNYSLVEMPMYLRATALVLVAVSCPAAFASAESASGFCPDRYKLWGAICMNDQTGDIVQPLTKGADYARLKASLPGGRFCGIWDSHVTTQIEDFGHARIVASDQLALAGSVQMIARSLCKEGRHAEAAALYESIFAGLD